VQHSKIAPIGPSWVKAGKSQSEQMLSGLPPKADLPILELLPPPALGERRHRGLARRLVAVRRHAVLRWPKASVHIHGEPSGAACTFMMRPTTAPSARTSKSSSVHSPDEREADARLRIRVKGQVPRRTNQAVSHDGWQPR